MSEHHHHSSHHHHHHHQHHASAAEKRTRGMIALIVLVVVVAVGVIIGGMYEQKQNVEQRTAMDEHFGKLPTMEYGGVTYRMRSGLTPVLLIGYDKTDSVQEGFRSGGQADFLLLMVIDHSNKQVYRLHLDRDSMTNVKVIGMTGREIGTSVKQICLAHAFGKTQEENNQYTMDAVSNMLQGVPLELYASMNLASLRQLNHILGGVTVKIEDDFSQYDEQMVPGAQLTLTDAQAELFLHSRMTIGDGANTSRMRRHRAYMAGAFDTIQKKLRADTGYANTLLELMDSILETNMAKGRIINELNSAATYDILPFDMLEGEHSIGRNGYVEFHVDEESIMNWIIRAYYEPMK